MGEYVCKERGCLRRYILVGVFIAYIKYIHYICVAFLPNGRESSEAFRIEPIINPNDWAMV